MFGVNDFSATISSPRPCSYANPVSSMTRSKWRGCEKNLIKFWTHSSQVISEMIRSLFRTRWLMGWRDGKWRHWHSETTPNKWDGKFWKIIFLLMPPELIPSARACFCQQRRRTPGMMEKWINGKTWIYFHVSSIKAFYRTPPFSLSSPYYLNFCLFLRTIRIQLVYTMEIEIA